METSEIENLLNNALPDCDINVEGGSGKYLVTVIGEVFEGLNSVKRQQLIYKILDSFITSGKIHAISMKLQTITENSNA